MKILKSIYFVALSAASLGVVSCGASGDDQGLEYAPQMYHSVAYEPLTQIQNEESGSWLSNREDGKGEFYNSNIYNPHKMNMREPVPNTVPRNQYDMLPYRLDVADLTASDSVKNPVELNDQVLAAGEQLFMQY